MHRRVKGNVVWHGHVYVVQGEYSDYWHGCVLEGPWLECAWVVSQ